MCILFFKALASYEYDTNEESKAAKYGTLIDTTIPFYMDKLEKTVGENNGYFANGKVVKNIVFSVFIDDTRKSFCDILHRHIFINLKSSNYNMDSSV